MRGTSCIDDAKGNRVVKVLGGYTANEYLLGLDGEQVAEVDGNETWRRTYVYGGGKELAKYDTNGVHFDFTDWLGTRRIAVAAPTNSAQDGATVADVVVWQQVSPN